MLKRIREGLRKLKSPRFRYAKYYKKCKVVENRILFESFHGQSISDSSYFMLLDLMKRAECGNYEIYYSTSDGKIKEHEEFVREHQLPVKLVSVDSDEYLELLASAKYLINNNSFPSYHIRKDGQVYLQTWHGTPLKTLGKQMREGLESMFYAQHTFLQASHIMFPNEYTRDAIMRDYNLTNLFTGKTVLCGYPRNSIFFDQEDAKAVRARYNLEGKKLFAYMPTWRGTSSSAVDPAYEAELRGMLDRIDEVLTEDTMLYVNFHQLMRGMKGLDNYKHIRQFPQDCNNYAFLNCCDALITDYSSVMFDYSITRKPIILFLYDFEEYMRERGMYLDIKELPFLTANTTEELCEYLSGSRPVACTYNVPSYCDRFIGYDTPTTPGDLLDVILHGREDVLKVEDYSRNCEVTRRVLEPEVTKNERDLELLRQSTGPDDVVILQRAKFTNALRTPLYETYNDAFEYVIRTDATPMTKLEFVLQFLNIGHTRKKLHQREIRRLFSNLPVEEEFVTKMFAPEEGCSIRAGEPIWLKAKLEQEGSTFKLTLLDKEQYSLEKILLVNKGTEIIAAFDADSGSGVWQEQARVIAAKLPNNKNHKIAGSVRVRSTGEQQLCLFEDPDYAKYDIDSIYKARKTDCFCEPVPVDPDPETGEELVLSLVPFKRSWMDSFYAAKSRTIGGLGRQTWATIVSYRAKGTRAYTDVVIPAIPGLHITGVVLKHRSKDELYRTVDFTLGTHPDGILVKTVFDFGGQILKEVYWDPFVICEWNGVTYRLRPHFASKRWKLWFYLRNLQYQVSDTHITFPQYRYGGFLAYTYRESSPYDGRWQIIREAFAYGIYKIFGVFLRRRNIWLVYEKQCNTAQDNGYFFFKYCMEQLPEKEKREIYYVMKKDSPDWDRVSMYGRNVIPFMSFRHLLYLLSAQLYIGSESKMHLYIWRAKVSLMRKRMRKIETMFLQHGVTALKQDHAIFGVRAGYRMHYFVTTSKFEHEIILNNFGYHAEKIPITGFSRWDVLEDKSTEADRTILMMPTWRGWLEEVQPEAFIESDYFRNYSALLKSEKLAELLERTNCDMLFYLHPKFAGYIETFLTDRPQSDRVRLVRFGEEPLNEIMMRARMLITDYSSVCWDMYYQKKPVLFYQFDLDKYNETNGSYIDMRTELFGRRTEDPDELLTLLEEMIAEDFRLPEKDLADYRKYFAYTDDQNSARIYRYLREMLELKEQKKYNKG
ncbi:MAG: CDP-glycerol glycerophosphotransferase family protein [Eubacterium sp.]|nr:CDP-glycerol glycerophosphotransferase family protein [Eubacterium sp.]